ncbi:hypothetical protein ABZN20_17700 [Methylococcus sp. ANG]|uniref:hypothetical protein n=1 Tax=Methylococcus sp. ANG TaxID=3231903 RepID=UPI0034596CE2
MKKALRQPPKLGVCWYTEEEWIKIKSEAIDPERFEATYPEWESMANKALEDLRETGMNPVKVIILVDELRQWCAIHGKENSAASRSAFVAELLGEKRAIIA